MNLFRLPLLVGLLLIAACSQTTPATPTAFTLAVIPDTQNMVSFKHQKNAGFALDGGEQYLQQMATIASWRDPAGEPLAFVVGVGDVWQHQSKVMDEEHRARGFVAIDNPYFASELAVTERVLSDEIPLAVAGYRKLADAAIPFGVAPGNHDHDAMWSVEGFPPDMTLAPRDIQMIPQHLGMLHIGGLDNFRSAFAADGEFFRDAAWYVASHDGGASSAQVFTAGGYRFLHIALTMQPSDAVLAWAHGVIDRYPGIPTIVSTHDYLNTQGERLPNPMVDLARVDPDQHNSAQQLWEKLLSQRDEIFLVLCGHQHAQSRRVDLNARGHEVHQVLADYQARGQSGLDAGQPVDSRRGVPAGLGDGWFRLMRFDMAAQPPRVHVRTYSSHYRAFSSDLPQYAQWYKRYEQPGLSDAEFLSGDDFTLELKDFSVRFAPCCKR